MVQIWTAQYRYAGPDRLDITVKGQDPLGKHFAPTWNIVMGHKRGELSDEEYTEIYHGLMVASYRNHRDAWEELLKRERIVLVCFCRPGKFCHRYLLASYLEKLGAEYKGEIRP